VDRPRRPPSHLRPPHTQRPRWRCSSTPTGRKSVTSLRLLGLSWVPKRVVAEALRCRCRKPAMPCPSRPFPWVSSDSTYVELYGRPVAGECVRTARAMCQVMPRSDYVVPQVFAIHRSAAGCVGRVLYATLAGSGQRGNTQHQPVQSRTHSAGCGRRPQVQRAVVMNPCDHPHGWWRGPRSDRRSGPRHPLGSLPSASKPESATSRATAFVLRKTSRTSTAEPWRGRDRDGHLTRFGTSALIRHGDVHFKKRDHFHRRFPTSAQGRGTQNSSGENP